MHPAASIVWFTTASGAGYGLLFLIGLLAPFGLLPQEDAFGAAALGLALGLVVFGLVASTFHLGHPERAWRALSQWRSSWLSREGLAALLTFIPALLLGAGWLLLDRVWLWAALLAALGAVVTVWCTAMIYRSLRAIPAWANPWTAPNYLALALFTGAVWLLLLLTAFGAPHRLVAGLAIASGLLAWACKLAYWGSVSAARAVATAESATGLAGPVRLLAAPHTEENYLMKEMGFQVARKLAPRLRRIVHLGLFALPLAATLACFAASGWAAVALGLIAAACASVGALVERWLFFAEAKHVVTLYYGARAA
jgi:DMSO reductase anchor subunit